MPGLVGPKVNSAARTDSLCPNTKCNTIVYVMIVIRHLVWDKGNRAHIARHSVTPDEVEQVCASKFVAFDAHKGRFLIVGLTKSGRALIP